MAEQNYRVKIKSGDVEIEAEGDKEFVEKQIKELKVEILKVGEKLPPEKKTVTSEIPEEGIGLAKLSLAEFYKQKQPKDHNATVVVFAYWLAKKKGQEEFQPKDISACYDEARISKPKNVTQHISAMASGKKACLTAGSKKGWHKLTLTGEEFVEKGLPLKTEE